MHSFFSSLIAQAQKRMQASRDPLHDVRHASRVVLHSQQIADELKIDKPAKDILLLAAWWHDSARALTKKPSIIWMRFVDDSISAFLLFKDAKKLNCMSPEVKVAIRIILSKNIWAGKLMSKILLPKQYHILLSILDDADTLDAIHLERVNVLRMLAEHSLWYTQGYRITIWWFLHSKEFSFHTRWARKHFETVLQSFLDWAGETDVSSWHAKQFSQVWLEKNIAHGKQLLHSQKTIVHKPSSFNG